MLYENDLETWRKLRMGRKSHVVRKKNKKNENNLVKDDKQSFRVCSRRDGVQHFVAIMLVSLPGTAAPPGHGALKAATPPRADVRRRHGPRIQMQSRRCWPAHPNGYPTVFNKHGRKKHGGEVREGWRTGTPWKQPRHSGPFRRRAVVLITCTSSFKKIEDLLQL